MSPFSYIAGALAVAFAATLNAQEAPIVVGAVISQTGSQAALAESYGKGLQVWRDEINAAGGLLGRRVELRVLDDHSEAASAGPAYAQLVSGGADLLVGPYGSAATLVAAAEAERTRHVMANGAGASARVYKRAQRWVFQTLAPYSSYGDGVLDVAQAAGCAALHVLARNDIASVEMGDAARTQALKRGLTVSELQTYSGGEQIAPLVASAAAAHVECWIAFGEARDAADIVIAMKRAQYAPRFLYLSAASDARFIEDVGQDAEYALGSVSYDPGWPTPYNELFAKAYAARWGRAPDAAAAQAYAAATVLARAVQHVGSLDQEQLRAALASLEIGTVLGTYRVGPGGEQLGMKPAVVQILRGRAVPVWPRSLAGDASPEPNRPWNERTLLK